MIAAPLPANGRCPDPDQFLALKAIDPRLARFSTAQERVSCLLGKLVALPLVAGRVVQCDEPLRPSQTRDRSRLPCSQMVPRLGELRVSFEECRFDENYVSVFRELSDLFDVRVRKGAIDNIGNLTACGDLHNLLFEKAKGENAALPEVPIMPCDIDQSAVRGAAKHRFLEVPKPRSDRKPHRLDLIAPYVDVSPLFERKGKDELTVVKYRRANLEAGS